MPIQFFVLLLLRENLKNMKNIILISLLLVAVACAHDEEREDYPTRSMMPNDTTDIDSGFTFRADTTWQDTVHINF